MGARVTRRRLLVSAGATGVGGMAIGSLAARSSDDQSARARGTGTVAFHGEHQAGILTPQQDHLHFAAFDLVTGNRDDLRELLRVWTVTAARLTQGLPAAPTEPTSLAPPADTGEAAGLLTSRLTVTIGLGTSLFDDRFGLRARKPGALRRLPALPGDELVASLSDGDLCVQACADDPQVAFHAVRNLARAARGVAVMRWSQLGFGRTSSTSSAQATPRNLLGFKDGTNNINAEDPPDQLARHLWVGAGDGPDWMTGGSYMVTRRIRMLIEVWDRAALDDQEATIGRQKASGAPLGARGEHDAVDLTAMHGATPVIAPDAHIRLAAPKTNDGVRLLRRGYSFTDGFDAELGQLDAGLFFIAFQRDPHEQFVKVQQRLATDALNEYIKHTSSGLFAVPPGIPDRPGRYLGDALFA